MMCSDNVSTDILATDISKLEDISVEVRRLILEIACRSKSAHVGSSMSCVDILVTLYFAVLDIDSNNWEKRDIFVLSKAHAAMALYSVLALKGFICEETLYGYLQNDGTLPAHLDRFKGVGVEASAGSLGHGFNMAIGMAHGYKAKGDNRRVFTVIGDGESEEGSIWEGALFASRLGVGNLTAILDYNNLQGYGRPRELCHYEPVADKWEAFGWNVCMVDGHNHKEILGALKRPDNGRPNIIIANTIKGKGIPYMEDEMKWHYFIVTDELKDKAMQYLSCRVNEK